MAETYYFRLPFYLVNGSSEKNVEIMFDNSVISSAQVSSEDSSNPNMVTFSVVKDFGRYSLKITPSPVVDFEDVFSTVCLEDIWISIDNLKYYSVLLNYSPDKEPVSLTPIVDDTGFVPDVEDIGFNPARGATMYGDVAVIIDIMLPSAENWNSLYNMESIEQIKESHDIISVSGPDEQKANLEKLTLAYDLFKARGYK